MVALLSSHNLESMTRESQCGTVLVELAYGNACVWLFLVGLIQVERVILNVGNPISWAGL